MWIVCDELEMTDVEKIMAYFILVFGHSPRGTEESPECASRDPNGIVPQ
jgi:hypothetical protein